MSFKKFKPSRHIDWNSEDGKAFRKFVIEYYTQTMDLCEEIIKQNFRYEKYPLVLFDKLSTPLVYLRDQWLLLPLEEKAKYNPKLKQIDEESKALAKNSFNEKHDQAEAISVEKIRNLLDEVQKELVEIKEGDKVIIVKPIGYIGELLWKSIHDRLSSLNAEWIKCDDPSKSHWEILKHS